MNFINNKKFGYFQLKAYSFYLSFSEETVIKDLQLQLPCFINSHFENNIKRAFYHNRLFESSNFLYL